MIQTDYRKYAFPLNTYETLRQSYTGESSVFIYVGIQDELEYVDVIWLNGEIMPWLVYEFYPAIDTQHTFLGVNDTQYNLEKNRTLALLEAYPYFINRDVTTMQMDILHKLVRQAPLSSKGIEPMKMYCYGNKPVWSINSTYWFETDNVLCNPNGIVKTHTWYNNDGQPQISTQSFIPMSDEKKERELKSFRENAINYLKSRSSELFNLLYTFFANDIKKYIDTGNKDEFEATLLEAKNNHPYIGNLPTPDGILENVPVVQIVLSQQIQVANSDNMISVIDGILAELL